ncbi:MAG: hypothetical protein WAN86_18590 [Hyphomicrobiaceae bacterium]
MTHPRRREWFVFDDRGNIWPAYSPELRRQLYCFSQSNDLALGLARNLGFVAGCQSGSSAALRLQLDLVSDIALAAAYYWLSDCEPRRVLIDYLGPPRPAEVFTSAETAIARLVRLTRDREASRHVAEKPCSVDQLAAGSPLHGLLELWAQNGGRYDAAAFSEYATRRLLKRFLVVRRDDANGLVFDTIGEGLHVPERGWFRSAIGRPIEHQPDAPYWRWVAQIQRSALQANDPVVSDIDASIYWPSLGRVRRRYRRLLLPCTAPDGTQLLFSANSSEGRLALRGPLGSAGSQVA